MIAHNNWTSYLAGARWVVIFDIPPEHGNRILMDGFPGVITSDDDFGVNSAGMMITETTITQFEGWNPEGKPEFMRSRKALQYANSIDDYVRISRKVTTADTPTTGSSGTARPERSLISS